MKIGELAKITHTPVETIRYYEKEELLPPAARTAANYRQYDRQHLKQLQFIRQCRALDLSLEEIRTLLRVRNEPAARCQTANQVLDEHIEHVETRIMELQELARQLHQLRQQCINDSTAEQCGILQELEQGQLMPEQSASHVK